MFDLDDIFASQDATVVFIYATAMLLVVCAAAALTIGLSAARQRVQKPGHDNVVQLTKKDLRRAA